MVMIFNHENIMSLDKLYRINLINSITGAKSANLVGSKSKQGVDNLAIFSSVVHLGSDPPYIGFFIRPQTFKKTDTFKNIIDNNFFTINSIDESIFKRSHLTSKKFDDNQSEFDHCSIEKTTINGFYAPFVMQSKIKIGLNLVEKKKIINDCTLIVGQVQLLSINDNDLDDFGRAKIHEMDIVSISGTDTYNRISKIETLPYISSKLKIEENLIEKKSTI